MKNNLRGIDKRQRKLSDVQFEAVRADRRSYRNIAEAFGISLSYVRDIKGGSVDRKPLAATATAKLACGRFYQPFRDGTYPR